MTEPSAADFAVLRDTLPRVWWNLYQGSLAQGFDKVQSFALVQTYILAQNPSGSRPSNDGGPASDIPDT